LIRTAQTGDIHDIVALWSRAGLKVESDSAIAELRSLLAAGRDLVLRHRSGQAPTRREPRNW
jgi:hypothetical protein